MHSLLGRDLRPLSRQLRKQALHASASLAIHCIKRLGQIGTAPETNRSPAHLNCTSVVCRRQKAGLIDP